MVGVEEVLAVIARSAETLIHGFEDHFVRQLGGGIPCHLSLWHIHPVLVVFNVLALDLDGGFEIIVRYFVVGGSEVLYMLGSDPWTHFGERAEPAIEVDARIGRYLHCDLVPGRRCGRSRAPSGSPSPTRGSTCTSRGTSPRARASRTTRAGPSPARRRRSGRSRWRPAPRCSARRSRSPRRSGS